MLHAAGDFEVTVTPLAPDDSIQGTSIGRFALNKRFHGDLEAASKGVMIGAGNLAAGTAGYVAIEEVTGSLQGRRGSFALQHNSTMDGGRFDIGVKVVPGSGSGELEGIAGIMTILIADRGHGYAFDYDLPSKE
jgi:Protein of unknown function (DUF3224)